MNLPLSLKEKKYDTVGTHPKSNRKMVEKGKILTPNTNTSPLTFLAWYRHFNKKWQG
jgi:hypothetical protein